MKVVVASDSFKGTLKSEEICDIASETVEEVFPNIELVCVPVADGGEGTVESFARATGAKLVTEPVTGPFFDTKVDATYAIKDDTAVIEMASTCGLPLVEELGRKKDPFITTTYGTGELILDALNRGCKNILLGLGGSSTNDGGCGCASALGIKFYNKNDESFVPVGGTLKDISHIVTDEAKTFSLTIMCDVDNPTVGERGAAFIFAPQKGAPKEKLFELDDGLINFCDIIEKDLSKVLHEMPGGGAAGGMGAGCVAFFDGKIVSGIEAILDATKFDEIIKDADLVVTGEGKLDSQSVNGKVISGISKRVDKPLVAIVGISEASPSDLALLKLRRVYETGDDRPVAELAKTAREDYKKTLIKCLEREI